MPVHPCRPSTFDVKNSLTGGRSSLPSSPGHGNLDSIDTTKIDLLPGPMCYFVLQMKGEDMGVYTEQSL